MTPTQLRNSILQSAITGALVPQTESDGTADTLIAQIEDEKRRLIAERNAAKIAAARDAGKSDAEIKKIKLEKYSAPKPVNQDECPFEIPKSWRWVRLGDVIELISGRDLEPNNYNSNNKGIPYMTGASNFTNGHLIINRWTEKPMVISHKGDLLITCKGTIGEMAYNEIGEVHIARQIMAIKPIVTLIDFVKYYLQSYVPILQTKAQSFIPGIAREDIIFAYFPLPPLPEQRRIVAKLEEILPLVEEYGEAQGELETLNAVLPSRLRKSLLQQAVKGLLVPQNPDEGAADALILQIEDEKRRLIAERNAKKIADARAAGKSDAEIKKIKLEKYTAPTPVNPEDAPFEIPQSWRWVRLGDGLINRDSERIPLSSSIRQNLDKTYDYYGASGVIDKVNKYLFDEELLLIGEDGANLLSRSTPIAFIAKGKFWVNNHAHVLQPYKCTDINYLCHYINAISLADYVTGTAQPKMNQDNMNKILIPLPPLTEQRRIVAKLEEMFAEIEKLENQE